MITSYSRRNFLYSMIKSFSILIITSLLTIGTAFADSTSCDTKSACSTNCTCTTTDATTMSMCSSICKIESTTDDGATIYVGTLPRCTNNCYAGSTPQCTTTCTAQSNQYNTTTGPAYLCQNLCYAGNSTINNPSSAQSYAPPNVPVTNATSGATTYYTPVIGSLPNCTSNCYATGDCPKCTGGTNMHCYCNQPATADSTPVDTVDTAKKP